MSLSGGKPKRPAMINSLAMLLGPDFMTDLIVVETSDHARLQLMLSYNWFFDVDKNNDDESEALFSVPDFVGDACKAIASRVRGAVAAVPFDKFHQNSAKIIRTSVMGVDEGTGRVRDNFRFTANNLVITNIDIQSVEPVDQKTRDALQKSVQLAIEITTQAQEAAARHKAEQEDQEAQGLLERQKLKDEAAAEESRKNLLRLQGESAAVESTGHATAEAKARAEADSIEGTAAVDQAKLRAEAQTIEAEAELARIKMTQDAELSHKAAINDMEVKKAQELAEIESRKFQEMVNALGTETIFSMARAGPEMQAKLLSGLGLKGYMITDGKSPINLLGTAKGFLSGADGAAAAEHDDVISVDE